jgi:DNA-binding transcriptional LysR family regulator
MELRQLRYFVAVAEELHFGRAAERLYVAQSPLSRQIRGLERELKTELLKRTTRRVELTAAGEVVLERSRRILREIDETIEVVARMAAPGTTPAGLGSRPARRAREGDQPQQGGKTGLVQVPA